jgi:hypothetical protein
MMKERRADQYQSSCCGSIFSTSLLLALVEALFAAATG